MDHDLIIRPTGKVGNKGERYEVMLSGEVIASGHSPEFAAVRALQEQGATGSARFWREGKRTWDFQIPIQKGASRCVVENNKLGPRFGKWMPNPLFANGDA